MGVIALMLSCQKSKQDYAEDARFYRSMSLDSLFNTDKPPKEAIRLVDSIYRRLPYISHYGHYHRYSRKYDYCIFIGDLKQGERYADSALNILQENDLETHYPEEFASALLRKGNIAFAVHHYDKAYTYYYQAKVFALQHLDTCKLGEFNYSIAMTLYRQQKFKQAISYFKESFASSSPACNYPAWRIQETLNNIALCYTQLNEPHRALHYYTKALQFIEQHKADIINDNYVRKAQAVIAGNIAKVYIQQNKLDQASELLKQSIRVNTGVNGDYRDGQSAQVQLAGIYLRQKRLDLLHDLLTDLEKGLSSHPNENAAIAWRQLMSAYYEQTRQPAKALSYYQGYVRTRDSVAKASAQALQTDVIEQLKSKDQESKITLLQKDNQLNKVYLYITIALVVLALTIILLVYGYYKRGRAHIQALILLNSEISEQKEKLEFAMAELEKSNADKERILKIVAHDLRNPISGIGTLTRSVLNDRMSPKDEKYVLTLIERASANSITLINELLELDFNGGRMEIEKAWTDMNEPVKRSVELMRLGAAKKNQELQLTLLPDTVLVCMNKDKIERVICNLLSNAIKFSPADERVQITMERRERSVVVFVQDKGMGIPAALQADIFNVFTEARRKGTAGEKSFGLGLSICKQIIGAHHGKIGVESEPGAGALFYIELPLQDNI